MDDPREEINEKHQGEKPVHLVRNLEQEENEHIQIGAELEQMSATPGWTILKTHLQDQYKPETFLNCPENQFAAKREQARAFMYVVSYVESYISKKARLLEKRAKQERKE